MSMDKMFGIVVAVGMTTLVVIVLALAFDKAAALPDVYFSYNTEECVKVVNYKDDNYSCNSLPGRYYHVWVE